MSCYFGKSAYIHTNTLVNNILRTLSPLTAAAFYTFVIGIQATVNISLALNIPVQTLSSYARPAGTAQDRPMLSPSGKECRAADCCGSGTLTSSRPYPRETTSNQRGHNPFTGYQPYAHSGRTVVPQLYPQPLRHPGPPALLQVISLGVNGGGLTTRRCRRRTSRAATTQAFPSERMLLRPRRSMTRLDLKRAAAAARCPTVLLEV